MNNRSLVNDVAVVGVGGAGTNIAFWQIYRIRYSCRALRSCRKQ